VEAFQKGIGTALVANLNKNVLADNPVKAGDKEEI
jgi:hypothetical protein